MTDEITPEHLAAGLPGTADLMVLVGNSWWKCAYAARGGNWALAAFYAAGTQSEGRIRCNLVGFDEGSEHRHQYN